MKCFSNTIRVATMFVGAVVGAGFATGREVAVFFANDGVINIVIASVFTAAVCFAFLYLGKINCIKNKSALFAMQTVVAVSALVVYAAMIAATENLLRELFSVRWLSVMLAAISMFFTLKNISAVKCLNIVAVPLIVIIVFLVGIDCKIASSHNAVNLWRSCGWSAMNMLFAGALMYREGGKMQHGEMLFASLLCGVTIGFLLLCMYKSIGGTLNCSMPFLASLCGTKRAFGIAALLCAIITTMASCNYLAYDYIKCICNKNSIAVFVVFAIGFALASVGFEFIVNRLYGVVSLLGLLVSVCALFCTAATMLKRCFATEKMQKVFHKIKKPLAFFCKRQNR